MGTKVDLRADRAVLDKHEELVSKEEGERMAESVKAAKYLECSALTQEGVKNVLNELILHHIEAKVKTRQELKKKKCNVL